MALQELRVNKLRTFLSLFGITIGIFCIIGVLATIDSMKRKVHQDISALGSNSVWIDKFDYGNGGPDYPWWKYIKRPTNKYADAMFLKTNVRQAENIAYFVPSTVTVAYEDNILQGVGLYGVTEDFSKMQDLKIAEGRYISDADFARGTPSCVIGYKNAEDLFGEGEAQRAVGQQIKINNKSVTVVGLIEKQGKSLLPGGFQFDATIIVSYKFFASMFDVMNVGQNLIMAQAKNGIPKEEFINELRGNMRQLHHLSPKDDDNFSLNDIDFLGSTLDGLFGSINMGGWAIAGLSLLVGAFGVANIMFVTVRERTSQIGLKKAIGAKRRTILTEFLLESAFLCIIGGLIGLLLVWILSKVLSTILPFPIFIAPNIIALAFSICIILGILAGIIPASIAAKMDPVVAIRTK
jgi:putative ABC transport system permease protein